MPRAPSVISLTLILLLALGLSPRAVRAQTTQTTCDSKPRALEINNTTLHYFECGEGEPLVFVHGALGNLHTFQIQAQAFATHFRVIAYSRRFFPPNAQPRATDVNAFSTHVADLRALITQLKAGPAHLVGNSGGAYVALALALDHPELVRSLVLGEPPILPLLSRTSVGEALRKSWISRVIEPSRKAFAAGSLEDGFRTFYNAICGSPCFDNLPESRRIELVEKQAPELRTYFLTDYYASLPSLSCDAIGKLKRPILLVTGERSPAMFLLITAELERCLDNESQVMVPEAGHGIHADNAAFYNEAVLRFLQRR